LAIPDDIYLKNLELEMQGFKHLQEGNHSEAEKVFALQYNLLLERQDKDGKRVHKGGPAHNLGVSLISQGKSGKGLWWLLMAFIEDVISEKQLFDSDNLPASRVLRGICGVNPNDLDNLENYVFQLRSRRLVLDPAEIYKIEPSLIDSIIKNSEDYAKKSFELEMLGSRRLAETIYVEAERTYTLWYEFLKKFQENRNVRLHKGHVLFQIGYSQLRRGKFPEALINHRLAYIEDVISERRVGDANTTAAYQNLKNVFGVRPEILAALERFVLEKMKTYVPMHPEEVDKEFLEKGFVPEQVVKRETISLEKKFSISRPPGELEKRVFIGGFYVLMPILREIKKIAIELGFQPIMASDFEIPKEKTDEYCNRLVGMCKYAIFEVTIDSGHLIELQTARSSAYIKTKTVFMAEDERKEIPKTMNTLVKTQSPAPEGYVTIDELKQIISEFLSAKA